LFCVILDCDRALSRIDFPDEPITVPVAVMAREFGAFRALAKHIDVLCNSNLRVYLPCDNANNLAGLRILSSLGVHACAQTNRRPLDWEALTDLMTYSVLGRTAHAPIEPFAFIAANYDSRSILDWSAIEFDDPERFLHLNEHGQVALSSDELQSGAFIAQDVRSIDSPAAAAAIRERKNAWRRYFVDNHPCAACTAWKVCLGRYSADPSEDKGCAAFFSELIEVIGVRRSSAQPRDERGIWQP
jgi:hypothetical protein